MKKMMKIISVGCLDEDNMQNQFLEFIVYFKQNERDDLHEWRALRSRQDEDYLLSLWTDQERVSTSGMQQAIQYDQEDADADTTATWMRVVWASETEAIGEA